VRRGRRTRTTIPAGDAAAWPPDLVNRDFRAPAPNRLWVVDITYVPLSGGGFAYVAFVIDAFSKMITGWKAAGHLRTSLALDALEMAVSARLRSGQQVAGVIHHSDHGSQYLAIRYTARLAQAGAIASAGTAGDSYDNALAETIIGLYKAELITHRGPWKTLAGVEAATARWVSWFNHRRLYGPLGDVPPPPNTSRPGWKATRHDPSGPGHPAPVLAAVKAMPCGRPAAALTAGCARRSIPAGGNGPPERLTRQQDQQAGKTESPRNPGRSNRAQPLQSHHCQPPHPRSPGQPGIPARLTPASPAQPRPPTTTDIPARNRPAHLAGQLIESATARITTPDP